MISSVKGERQHGHAFENRRAVTAMRLAGG